MTGAVRSRSPSFISSSRIEVREVAISELRYDYEPTSTETVPTVDTTAGRRYCLRARTKLPREIWEPTRCFCFLPCGRRGLPRTSRLARLLFGVRRGRGQNRRPAGDTPGIMAAKMARPACLPAAARTYTGGGSSVRGSIASGIVALDGLQASGLLGVCSACTFSRQVLCSISPPPPSPS